MSELDLMGQDSSDPAFDSDPLLWPYPWFEVGAIVSSPIFPGKTFVVGPDKKLKSREGFQPGDRALLYFNQWYVLQSDGKTWKPE